MKSTIAYTGLLSACSILVALFLPWWVLMLLSFVLAFCLVVFKPFQKVHEVLYANRLNLRNFTPKTALIEIPVSVSLSDLLF